MSSLPRHAQAVVIGGGAAGCSVAYHLAKQGWSDVLLLEQAQLSSGTTWHAAGLVGQLRPSANLTRLIRASAELYAGLEAETGQATGWRACGAVNLAATPDRLVELHRAAAMATAFGVEAHVVTAAEAGRLWPHMRTADLAGAAWLPGDGKVNPTDLVQALAKGARARGVRIVEGVRVTGVGVREAGHGRRVTGVETSHGPVAADVVVNCAGQWARGLGRLAGVDVPLVSAEHMYVVTRPLGLGADLPVLRDYDNRVYFKEEVGGLVMGGFESAARPWQVDAIPDDFAFSLLPEDWDQFQELMEGALRRCPLMEEAPIRQLLVGPESFTPDGRFLMGEAAGLAGFFVLAGFNSAGIASAGGAGQALARWIEAGEPPMDLWEVDLRRFGPEQANPRFLAARVVEEVGLHYALHWPDREPESGRRLRLSPLHDRLAAAGARFGQRFGWERPLHFEEAGTDPAPAHRWGRPAWHDRVAAEHRAARERVALFDQSSFGKLEVSGPDAAAALGRLSARDVDVPVGRIVYTVMLNRRGGIECDLTVTRLAADRFLLVTAAATVLRDADWLRRSLGEAERVRVTDVTTASAVLSVIGPRARLLLERLAAGDMSDAAHPYLAARDVHLGPARVRAHRVSYAGELGWELYVPVESAVPLYDALLGAGRDLGLTHAGYRALDGLRMEKGYLSWGHDIGPDDSPLAAGLGALLRLDGPRDFVGRDALRRERDAGPARRLLQFRVERGDRDVWAWHDEPVYRDGRLAGRTSSAAFGHTAGALLAFAWIDDPDRLGPAGLRDGRFEIDLAGGRLPLVPLDRPPHDPAGRRLRG